LQPSDTSTYKNLHCFQNKCIKILSEVPWMLATKSFYSHLRLDTVLEWNRLLADRMCVVHPISTQWQMGQCGLTIDKCVEKDNIYLLHSRLHS
jgi:hypothetical protein